MFRESRHGIRFDGFGKRIFTHEQTSWLQSPFILVVAFATACGSAGDENSVASLPTADISSFPTPSRSQATRQPDPQPTSPAPAAETQDDSEDSDDAESLIADAPPITAEEIQELRERLGRGETE